MNVSRCLVAVLTFLSATAFANEDEDLAEPEATAAGSDQGTPSVGVALKPLAPVRRILKLRRCLELADANFPKIAEARSRRDSKAAQEQQAIYAPFSEFTTTAGLALAPTVRGLSVFSPNTDVTLSSSMALAWQARVEGVLPLYTFGKLSHGWSAAAAQTKVGDYEIKKEINETRLLVRKAFYAIQLARDALALIHDAAALIDEHIAKMAKEQPGEVDDIELLRLREQRADLDARAADARKQEASAMAGLRFLTGQAEPFDIPNEPLRPVTYSLGPLSQYLSAARLFRPEINMAAAGVTARRELLRLERARYFPDLGLAMGASWSYAPEITDQTNPFVRDGANFLYYQLGIVLRYKLDFLPQTARVDQAAAQLREMEATERFALGGVGQQVEEAYAEVKNMRDKLDATSRAARYAQQWLIRVQQGIEVGTLDEEDLVLPAKEYALQKFAQMSATFDFNVAYAKLALSTGWDQALVD
jgi:outer membrane protein TolC